MPVLALRGLSVFPGMLLNFDVERPMSVAALNFAMGADQVIFLTAQKEITKDVPFLDDIYARGHRLPREADAAPAGRQERARDGGGRGPRAHRRPHRRPALPVRGDRPRAGRGGEAQRQDGGALPPLHGALRRVRRDIRQRGAGERHQHHDEHGRGLCLRLHRAEHLSQAARRSRSCWRSCAPRAGWLRSAVCSRASSRC